MTLLTRLRTSTPTTAGATALAAIVIAALGQHVHAQAVFVAQQRSVSASSEGCYNDAGAWVCDDDEDAASAADFGEFVAEADAAVSNPYTGTGHAAQESSLGSAEILAWGEVLATGEGGGSPCPVGDALGSAASLFKTTFDLAAPTTYRLNGYVARFGGDAAFVRLTGPGGLDLMFAPTGPSPLPIDTSGTLVPGTYELSAEATNNNSFNFSGAGFSARLAFGPSGGSTPASVTLVSQSRFVEWFKIHCDPGGCDKQGGSQSAPDFGLFDATVGSASQSSDILPTSFKATGAVTPEVWAWTTFEGGAMAAETSTSSFSVTFEVNATVRARVRAAVVGGATFTLAPGGPSLGGGVFDVVDELVVLPPGTYSVEAIASSSIKAPFCIDHDNDYRAFTLAVDFEMFEGDHDLVVPTEYATIALAIAAAVYGDTIIIEPGTYFEHLSLVDKNVSIIAATGGEVVIDGGGLPGTILTVSGGQGAEAVIRGITFRNSSEGSPLPQSPQLLVGGAALVHDASPRFEQCRFENNHCSMFGGAVYTLLSSSVFKDCVFEGNSSGIDGGALQALNSAIDVSNSTFTGNSAGNLGGAMHLPLSIAFGDNLVEVYGCTFTGNEAVIGGGLTFYPGAAPTHALVAGSTFTDNIGTSTAGAIWALPDAPGALLLSWTSICGNSSPQLVAPGFLDIGGNEICERIGDLSGDGSVNAADLTILLGGWGGSASADLDGDGTVDAADLTILLGAWTG